jgi:hypothetical protein
MRIEQTRPTQVTVQMHSLEMATLAAAARWVVDGCPGELPPQAKENLRQVLQSYDAAWNQARHNSLELTPESA